MGRQSYQAEQQAWTCVACGVINEAQASMCRECRASRQMGARLLARQQRRVFLTRRKVLTAGVVFAGGGLAWFVVHEWLDWWRAQPALSISLDQRSAVDNSDSLAWSPDGASIACTVAVNAYAQSKLLVLDAGSGKQKWSHEEPGQWLQALAWSSRGQRLAVARRPYGNKLSNPSALTIQIWQTQDWQVLAEYPVSSDAYQDVFGLAWSPDATLLAVALSSEQAKPSSIQIWDILHGNILQDYQEKPPSQGQLLGWSPDGNSLATGGQEGELRLWDWRTGATLFYRAPDASPGYTDSANDVPLLVSGPVAALSPDWSRAAIYIHDHGNQLSIQIWDVHEHKPIFRCQSVAGQQGDLTWSPNGKYIAACGYSNGNVVNLWDASSGAWLFTYNTRVLPGNLSWSPDSRFLALTAYNQYGFLKGPPHDSVLQIFAVE